MARGSGRSTRDVRRDRGADNVGRHGSSQRSSNCSGLPAYRSGEALEASCSVGADIRSLVSDYDDRLQRALAILRMVQSDAGRLHALGSDGLAVERGAREGNGAFLGMVADVASGYVHDGGLCELSAVRTPSGGLWPAV